MIIFHRKGRAAKNNRKITIGAKNLPKAAEYKIKGIIVKDNGSAYLIQKPINFWQMDGFWTNSVRMGIHIIKAVFTKTFHSQ